MKFDNHTPNWRPSLWNFGNQWQGPDSSLASPKREHQRSISIIFKHVVTTRMLRFYPSHGLGEKKPVLESLKSPFQSCAARSCMCTSLHVEKPLSGWDPGDHMTQDSLKIHKYPLTEANEQPIALDSWIKNHEGEESLSVLHQKSRSQVKGCVQHDPKFERQRGNLGVTTWTPHSQICSQEFSYNNPCAQDASLVG